MLARTPLFLIGAGTVGAVLMVLGVLPAADTTRGAVEESPAGKATLPAQASPTRTTPLLRIAKLAADPPGLAHEQGGLCSTSHILPVAFFYDDFVDSIGSHYHGWEPPAGPPFYACCGGPCAIFDGLHSVQ